VFRSEIELPFGLVKKDRLLAETITRQKERSSRRVPHREREHTVELFHERLAVTLVQVHDDLGIRPCAESVALLRELLPKLLEVVDLAVENGPGLSVLAGLRLIPRHEVDDPKSAYPESSVWIVVFTRRIRTPVRERLAHEPHLRDTLTLRLTYDADDPAHLSRRPSLGSRAWDPAAYLRA
jgi:hypothetical protein